MTDLLTDLLIYIGFGIIMFAIGSISGHQILKLHYSKRFMVLAKECSDTDSVVPIVDELARET
ncbi:MAG: hypothetical protein ABSG28_05770 [Methanoregula sp.]|jgi:uncharacterized Fe-S center protein|uniref:hypothetical protein n=1 Tax=Methanoregula sp. TaxID=2052170 RepID=UPI003C1E9414